MSTANTTASGAATTSWSLNSKSDEIDYYIVDFRGSHGQTKAMSALWRILTYFAPMAIWDREDSFASSCIPGGRGQIDITKDSDGIMGMTLLARAPMVCDAGSTGYLTSVTTTATQYFVDGNAAIVVPTLTYTAGTTGGVAGTNGVASLTMVPSQLGHSFQISQTNSAMAFSMNVGCPLIITTSNGGVMTFCCNTLVNCSGTALQTALCNLTSYSGNLTGTFSGTPLFNNFNTGPGTNYSTSVTATGSFIAFNAAWAVTTAGSKIANGTTPASLSAANWYTTAATSTPLTLANCGTLTTGIEEGTNVHNSYYVNGFCASSIQALTIQQGGLTLCQDVSGAALRRMERAIRRKDDWNQSVVTNFGSLPQIQLWAHRVPYQSGSTSIPNQAFNYDLPLFSDPSDALWLNVQRGGTVTVKVTFTTIDQLVVASTTGLNATSAVTPNTRMGNHADSGVQLTSNNITYTMNFIYYSLTNAERNWFYQINAARIHRTISSGQRTSVPQQSTVPAIQNIQYQPTKLAYCQIIAAQEDNYSRPITNGKFDQHSYLRDVRGSQPSIASASVLHVPVLQDVEEQYQGSKRVVLVPENVNSYAFYLPGGTQACDTGVWYIPYDTIPKLQPGNYTTFNPNSAIDKHAYNVRVLPNTGTASSGSTIFLEHIMIIFGLYQGNCVQQVFM